MKNTTLFYLVFLPWLLLTLLWDCKKEAIKVAPTVSITSLSSITYTSAIIGWNVTSDGGATITACGVCWGTNQNPTTSDSKINSAAGTGSFFCMLTGLNPGTTYTIKAFATNSVETAYSNQATFSTVAYSSLFTNDISAITPTTAASGGNIFNDGGSAITARGVCWATTQSPTTSNSKTTDGTGSGTFTSILTGLTRSTTYYVKAYATNNLGTSYGGQTTFTTLAEAVAPVVTTRAVLSVTNTTATSGGNIKSDGGSEIIAKGVCWATTKSPTIYNNKTIDGMGPGSFTSSITGLITGTTYYVSAYATNGIATSYGSEISFTAGSTTVSDIDGNIYHYIVIGTQTWMVENLKTIHYRNGDAIPNVTISLDWDVLVTGAYCWYNNDVPTYKAAYGALYNWYVVNDSRNIAPAGWHVPTDAEWTILIDFLGGESVAGVKLKETGNSH